IGAGGRHLFRRAGFRRRYRIPLSVHLRALAHAATCPELRDLRPLLPNDRDAPRAHRRTGAVSWLARCAAGAAPQGSGARDSADVVPALCADRYARVRRGGWTHMITVRNPTPAEWRDWDLVVARFPNSRIVHQRAWIEWLEACGCGSPLCLIVERDGEIIGASPGLLARMGPLRLYGSPLPGWQTPMMGPVFDPERVGARELILALLSFLERRHGVHHVELLSDSLDGSAMRHLGFRAETVPTYR